MPESKSAGISVQAVPFQEKPNDPYPEPSATHCEGAVHETAVNLGAMDGRSGHSRWQGGAVPNFPTGCGVERQTEPFHRMAPGPCVTPTP